MSHEKQAERAYIALQAAGRLDATQVAGMAHVANAHALMALYELLKDRLPGSPEESAYKFYLGEEP